jgi:lipopolysaccharide export system protein LptA
MILSTATTLRTLAARFTFTALLLTLAPIAAHAEQADKEKPINFSAEQPAEVDFEKRVGTLRGNVVITQGTITIRADRIDFKQNADNSMSATAYGNPISFRQKKDGVNEYYEGYAQKAVYDGQKDLLELFDRALLKQGTDEIRSNYISYNNTTGQFKAEGRPDQPGAQSGPGKRVTGVFQPKSETPGLKLPGKSAGKDATKDGGKDSGKDASKDGAKDTNDGGKSAAKSPQADAAKSAAKPPAPLTLTPDAGIKQQ